MNECVILVGLGFGDEGKGSCVDYCTRKLGAKTVIRFNGGGQAAHHVVDDETGNSHVFSQFGSGTFVPGVQTFLSKYMLVDPLALIKENSHLASIGVTDALQRMIIDPEALIVTPYQIMVNRIREIARGKGRHGSCGMGIGETMQDSLNGDNWWMVRAGDLKTRDVLVDKLEETRHRKFEESREIRVGNLGADDYSMLAQCLSVLDDPESVTRFADSYCGLAKKILILPMLPYFLANGPTVFEGAQGVLLDEWHGFHPYTTWSATTTRNALNLIADSDVDVEVTRIGVIRAYMTRHGPGPFPTYDENLTKLLPDSTNGTGRWQGDFKVGHLDIPLLKYALEVSDVDELAVTCLDRMATTSAKFKVCTEYSGVQLTPVFDHDLDYQEHLGATVGLAKPVYEPVDNVSIIKCIEATLGKPISIASYGPRAGDKLDTKSSIPVSTVHQ